MTAFYDTSSNLHPYECAGPGQCSHCDRDTHRNHDPANCELCDPEYDGMPNPYRSETEPSDSPSQPSSPPPRSPSPAPPKHTTGSTP